MNPQRGPKLTFHWQPLAPLAVIVASFNAMPLIVTKIYNYRYNNKVIYLFPTMFLEVVLILIILVSAMCYLGF